MTRSDERSARHVTEREKQRRQEEKTMNELKVQDVMTRLVITLSPEASIQEAAQKLLQGRISGAPVVDGGRLVGIVSEADLVAAYAPPSDKRHWRTVADMMVKQVVSISPTASVWEAATLIDRRRVRRLPVVDPDGCVIGIVTRSDLIRAMARSDGEISAGVKGALEILGEENFTSLDVEVTDGAVSLRGTADRRTTRDIAGRMAAQVPGVLEVIDELTWRWDDRHIKPMGTPIDPNAVGDDPWAVGHLVKEPG
jgi:CBS domain-containing protein